MYRVTVYFRDDGLNKIGTTRVEAENEDEARKKTMDELWDQRLDAPAFCEVEPVTLDRSCGLKLNESCPECDSEQAFGYAYEADELQKPADVEVLQCTDCDYEWQTN